jgi:hypothetical protein
VIFEIKLGWSILETTFHATIFNRRDYPSGNAGRQV